MNRFRSMALMLVVALATLGCVSTKGRELSLLPAIRTAWPAVQSDLAVGIDDAAAGGQDVSAVRVAVVDLDEAIVNGDALFVANVPWAVLEPYGERGVQVKVTNGTISPLVAPSLLERLHKFGEAIAKMRLIP